MYAAGKKQIKAILADLTKHSTALEEIEQELEGKLELLDEDDSSSSKAEEIQDDMDMLLGAVDTLADLVMTLENLV